MLSYHAISIGSNQRQLLQPMIILGPPAVPGAQEFSSHLLLFTGRLSGLVCQAQVRRRKLSDSSLTNLMVSGTNFQFIPISSTPINHRSQPLPPGAPHSPLIACNLLPIDFIACDDILDLRGNITARQELGYGCVNFGGQKYNEVEFTSVKCAALDGIECHGNRTFRREGIPCIKYTNHYFLTTLLYSILLGLAGIDRFCLGHVGAAVGKLLTLGGGGIWWLIDIILLITGQLMPEDGSNWIPYV